MTGVFPTTPFKTLKAGTATDELVAGVAGVFDVFPVDAGAALRVAIYATTKAAPNAKPTDTLPQFILRTDVLLSDRGVHSRDGRSDRTSRRIVQQHDYRICRTDIRS